MIVLFTANEKGGIIQFTLELAKNIAELNEEVVCFVPSMAKLSTINGKYRIVTYEKVKVINRYDKRISIICKNILKENPSLVWFCDESILCSEIGLRLHNKVQEMMTFHDAGVAHPTWGTSLKNRVRRWFEKTIGYKCARTIEHVLLLSPESRATYLGIFPEHSDKVHELLLGAHIPEVDASKPIELANIEYAPFLLFFGRIDKYKGLENILSAYNEAQCSQCKFIVAGKGELSENEKNCCNKNENIILLNRFIEDSEMIWLVENCLAVCLPYIEATQSGVIPISYKLGKAVISSDVKGLIQFVEDKETGLICKNQEDYINAIKFMANEENSSFLGEKAQKYYYDRLEWKNGLKKLLSEVLR